MLEIKKILYKLSCTAEPSHLYGKISCWERSKLSKRESQHFLLENAIWSPAPSPRLHDRFSCGELFETFSETFWHGPYFASWFGGGSFRFMNGTMRLNSQTGIHFASFKSSWLLAVHRSVIVTGVNHSHFPPEPTVNVNISSPGKNTANWLSKPRINFPAWNTVVTSFCLYIFTRSCIFQRPTAIYFSHQFFRVC